MSMRWTMLMLAAILLGCPSEGAGPMPPPSDAKVAEDYGSDVELIKDASELDASAPPDGGSPDVPARDSPASDLARDGRADAGPDAGPDAAPDAARDAAPDAAPDVASPADATPVTCAIDATIRALTPSDAGAGACPRAPERELLLPADGVDGMIAGPPVGAAPYCAGARGPERYFPLRIRALTGVQVRVRSDVMDPVVSIRTNCASAASTVACNDDVTFSLRTAQVRAVLAPGDYHVVVGANSFAGGTLFDSRYRLDLESFDPSPNAVCEDALPLTAGCAYTDQDTGRGLVRSTGCIPGAPALYYHLTVPPATQAVVTATRRGGGAAVLTALPTCEETCAARPGDPSTRTLTNDTPDPLTRLLVLLPESYSDRTRADVSVSMRPLDLLPHADCAAPRTVADGTELRGEDLAQGLSGRTSGCAAELAGFDHILYYRATIPPRRTLYVTGITESGGLPRYALLESCAATRCAAPIPFGTSQLRVDNPDSSSREALFGVLGRSRVNLSVMVTTLGGTPRPNASCAEATGIVDGYSNPGDNLVHARDRLDAVCAPAARGPVLYYRTIVRSGESLAVRATGRSGEARTVRFLDRCGATSCLGSASGAGEVAGLYENTAPASREVIVAIGSDLAGEALAGVDVVSRSIPPYGRCATAALTSSGRTYVDQDARRGAEFSPCSPTPERALFYRVTVRPNEAVNARQGLVPDPRLRVGLIDACDTRACVVSAPPGMDLRWVNRGPSTVERIVVASAPWLDGPFTLAVSVTSGD